MDQQDLVARVQDLAEGSKQLDRLLDALRQSAGDRGTAAHRDALLALMTVARELAAATQSMVAATRSMTALSRELTDRSRDTVARSRKMIRRAEPLVRAGASAPVQRPEMPGPEVGPTMAPMLARLAGFGQLTHEERQILRDAVLRVQHVPAGTDVATQNSRPRESAVLLDGFTARCKLLMNGRRQITAIHVPGDLVDLQSFLLRPMDHTVAALTDCRVAVIPHETLQRITETRPALARLFWFSTLVDGAIQRERLVAVGRQSSRARVAHVLCELFLRLRVVGLARREGSLQIFPLPLTQTDLGDMLGLTGVHVSRTLRSLRQQELVTWSGKTVCILDWQRLAQVAEFDSTYLYLPEKDRQHPDDHGARSYPAL